MDEGKRAGKTLRRYPPETRAEAVRLVVDEYMTSAEVAERFAMPEGTVSAWASWERMARRRAAAQRRKEAEEAAMQEATPDVTYQELQATIENLGARNAVLMIALNQIRDLIDTTFETLSK